MNKESVNQSLVSLYDTEEKEITVLIVNAQRNHDGTATATIKDCLGIRAKALVCYDFAVTAIELVGTNVWTTMKRTEKRKGCAYVISELYLDDDKVDKNINLLKDEPALSNLINRIALCPGVCTYVAVAALLEHADDVKGIYDDNAISVRKERYLDRMFQNVSAVHFVCDTYVEPGLNRSRMAAGIFFLELGAMINEMSEGLDSVLPASILCTREIDVVIEELSVTGNNISEIDDLKFLVLSAGGIIAYKTAEASIIDDLLRLQERIKENVDSLYIPCECDTGEE
jgi:hypothetical protein